MPLRSSDTFDSRAIWPREINLFRVPSQSTATFKNTADFFGWLRIEIRFIEKIPASLKKVNFVCRDDRALGFGVVLKKT
jgi:hypothetical protein